MQVFQLHSFPLEQLTNLEVAEQRWGAWHIARPYPKRLIAHSTAFSMRGPLRQMQQAQRPLEQVAQVALPVMQAIDAWLADAHAPHPATVLAALPASQLALLVDCCAGHPQLQDAALGAPVAAEQERRTYAALADTLARAIWRLPWMKETTRFYELLEAQFIRAAHYYLVTWEPKDITARSQATTLQQTFGRPVEMLDQLPSILPGEYEEQATCLAPVRPGHPWYAVLLAYDLQDEWHAASLHPLLLQPFEVAVSVDFTTMPRPKAQRVAELSFNASRLVMSDKNVLDTRAQRAIQDAEYALHEIRHQTLHEIQIAVLVGGATKEELEHHLVTIRDLLSPKLRLMRVNGCQGELIKLFGTTPRSRIDAPFKPRTQLSHGLGCLFGMLGLHRQSTTAGLFMGIDAMRHNPVFLDLFAGNQAAHSVILGKSGYGKTVFLNTVAERAAAVGGMQVIGIDAFRNGYRVAQHIPGAVCYGIGLEHTINIFDIVFARETEGGWLASQVLHVVNQLSLLLGTPAENANGKKFYAARAFSIRERGILGRAISDLYADCDPDTALADLPTMTALMVRLEAEDTPLATELAIDLRYYVFGSADPTVTTRTPEGRAFDGATTIDWNFSQDITYYDFSQVPELLLPFYYVQAIGAIWRYVRQPGRDLRRPIFLQIDEYGYASQVASVETLAVDIAKTARKYKCGIMLVDQNPQTFFATEGGRKIYENAAARVCFHLDDIAARDVGAAISDLTPQHVALLPQLTPGTCLTVLGNDVYVITNELNPLEQMAFIGS